MYSVVSRGLEMSATKENMMHLSPTLKMPDTDSTELWGLQSATPLSVTSHPRCWPCVASCCWGCGHVCSHSERRRQCGNRPHRALTQTCSHLVAFPEVPVLLLLPMPGSESELSHTCCQWAGREYDVFTGHVVTSSDLRMLLLRRMRSRGMGFNW